MFPGMMDPELMRLAQEQMSRMSPSDFSKIQQQMMSNPDLMRMASESMKNMRPEDLKHAAEQMKYARPDDMAEIGEKMANATPEEFATMRARADAQATYELNAAQMLKKQGNELHSHGNFNGALQKYLLAKKNLRGIPSAKGRSLLLACSLNLMSCYLKTKQYDECIEEGTEVLSYDAKNVKALYRRGQAYKELGRLEDAVSDLNQAHEVSPDDETIADVLRDAEQRLTEEGGVPRRRGLVIEEITEEVQSSVPGDHDISGSEYPTSAPQGPRETSSRVPSSNTESIQALRDDPESIRTFQNFISQADPETLAALGGGKTEGISPDMVKTASNMLSKMPPEELQRMLQLASSFQGGNTGEGSRDSSFGPGFPSNVTPDMLKTASDMMSKMPAEEMQKMFEMASSLRGKDSGSAATPKFQSNGVQSNGSNSHGSPETSTLNGNHLRERSSSRGPQSNLANSPQNSFPSSSADIQEQMRDQMKNPAMRQMLSTMMQNMSPDMMANMSEQFGFKLSREDAEKAQAAMSSLSPDALEKMMKWADRIQRGAEGARKTKDWLLGRRGMVLAICMLIFAVILHWFGYIGS
ncbi:Outer envelope protein 61 [Heracleum sosnowskyi]|uniref:Outer envelope protein 61 n=1 Tax=Heracleum sosnowskyi TaxID=360622 RepID=A0AAD8GU24_9APIA|nr:Outer envelope protein 61 [Heracleum sosnowskyi]